MKKFVLGLIVFVVAGFILQLNNAYALNVTVDNHYKTKVRVNITRGGTQLKDAVWDYIDVTKYWDYLNGGKTQWWKAIIPSKRSLEHDDVGGDSNTINEILIEFMGEQESNTIIDPRIPGKVGATSIIITVKDNGDLEVSWLNQRKNLGSGLFDLPEELAKKTYRKDEKFSQYLPDKDYNGALRVQGPGTWVTIKMKTGEKLTSDHLGLATGKATIKNYSKYYKVQLRGMDENGNPKKYEWWQPGETKSFDFKGGLEKNVQCLQVWLAPKCPRSDDACKSSKAEKTPIGFGKWEQSCTIDQGTSNIKFENIEKSGGGAPDRLGLR